jgi:peptidoglycan hydrolase-like protein with peptidoglycan-binding domain
MRTFSLPVLLVSSLALAAPLKADTDLGKVFSGVAQSLINQELDKNAYIAAQSANTVSAYRGYLANYPSGIYRANAERALAKLGAAADGTTQPPATGGSLTAAQEEAAIGLTFSERVTIQRKLTALGFNTRGADGAFGYNTRTAIAGWQRANRQPVTSYLTGAQVNLLQRQSGSVVTPPTDDTSSYSAPQIEASIGLTRSQRVEIQRQLTKIGYDAGGADGLWGSKTRAAIKSWQAANKVSATGYVTAAQVDLMAKQAGPVAEAPTGGYGNVALEETLLGLTSYERADIQRRLTRLGYNTYGADGVWGPNTRRALRQWQADEGLSVTGYITADQVRKVRVETGG